MARKSSTQMFEEAQKGTATNGKAKRYNDVQFVNFELDVNLQAQCKAWKLSELEAWEQLAKWQDSGYKFTFKYDGYSKSSAVFVSATAETDQNFGYILTGRGSEPYKALKQALFKHYICFEGHAWADFAERPDMFSIDD